MASTVVMPKQGNTVESCILLEWKKQEGDTIAEGDILCEAETDKATIEVESTASGTVLKLLWEVDDEIPVQQPIAVIGEQGEDISSLVDEAPQAAPEATQEPEVLEEPREPEPKDLPIERSSPQSGVGSSPRARNRAGKHHLDISGLQGSGPGNRVIERDVEAALQERGAMTPAAAQRASQEGSSAVSEGTGIGGRIRYADFDRQDPDAQSAEAVDFPGAARSVPVKGIRKITAERMYQSLQNTCQLTMSASADASALLAFRKRCKHSDPELGMSTVTINDMILFAVSRTAAQFPYMNAHFLGEEIREFDHTHIGIAVDTPKGLMVPVLQYADLRSLGDLSRKAKELSGACIAGKAKPEFFQGGTFTVTNLGSLGIEHFTPVLNVPEVAILGVNAITQHPVEQDGVITLQPRIGFSLTFDHQAVDGAPAARFLKALIQAVEAIDLTAAR